MSLCPRCRLPMRHLARAVAVSNDEGRHAVIGLCRLCDKELSRSPPTAQADKMLNAAGRALADPARYVCSLMPDRGAAELAVALLGYEPLATEAMRAIGWIDSDCTGFQGHGAGVPSRLWQGSALNQRG